MDCRPRWLAASTALAAGIGMLGTAPAATEVHVVDQSFTFNDIRPGGQLPAIEVDRAGNGQTFVPRLNNVSFAFFWGREGYLPASVALEPITASGTISSPAQLSSSVVDGLRKGFFPYPIRVTPGETYFLNVFPTYTGALGATAGNLQAFRPGGYRWGRGLVDGLPIDELDYYFIEGGVVEQLPSTGTLVPAPQGTMRFTTRSVSSDPGTQTRWQHPAIGGARFYLTGTQEGFLETGFDRSANRASTRFDLHFRDNDNGIGDSQTLGVSLTDTVTLDNPTDQDKTVFVGGLFDASATFAAGTNPTITMLLFVDGQARSSGRSYTAGTDADIEQSVTPFSVLVPRRSTRTVAIRQDVFIAVPEGSSVAAGNSLTVDFTLPEGVTMTSLLAAPVPEPETYALMLCGLGLVCRQFWCRRSRAAARRFA